MEKISHKFAKRENRRPINRKNQEKHYYFMLSSNDNRFYFLTKR
jgi:hypothetical protein